VDGGGVEVAGFEATCHHLLKQIPAERLFFGSHPPLFYFESAALKLKASVLIAEQDHALRSDRPGVFALDQAAPPR
jgi:hypothetical protein